MPSPQDPAYGRVAAVGVSNDEPYRLRSYQQEMVDVSLRRNVIVAMDTGSGKTHIAIARTAVALDTCDRHQLVWFLTPTVALLKQQSEVFRLNLPGYGIQVLSGEDGPEKWSDQNTWDIVLDNIRIVLSTHQVLLDALSHGFVRMSRLALIVFDEAHHCTLNHPANVILSQFYAPEIGGHNEGSLPRILGLTASPVMRAKAGDSDLRKIENNLHAVTKTPKVHRLELERHVHKPELVEVKYAINYTAMPPSLKFLQSEVTNYDFGADPYIVRLIERQRSGIDTSNQLETAWLNCKTYCHQQLKTLSSRATSMLHELGVSAVEWYLQKCISCALVHNSDQQFFDWTQNEQQHLLDILQRIHLSMNLRQKPIQFPHVSPKVEALVEVLLSEISPNLRGIIFIEQRAWVATLAEILAVHPAICGRLTIGTFLGTSVSSKKQNQVANLAEPCHQLDTLAKFREGKTNMVLATSVLEEGIDISSCHLVICFERPKNLKSFVQRRGRARKQGSKYIIFSSSVNDLQSSTHWESLENEMRKAYQDDLRESGTAAVQEPSDEKGERFFKVPKTGALLTLDNAVQHLYHFCSITTSSIYVDSRPQFSFEEVQGGRISAEVMLPLSVDPTVRSTRSIKNWQTERTAMKDASFEAYIALHRCGLVNDNLLPARQEADDLASEFQVADNTPSLIELSSGFDPWMSIATFQAQNPFTYHRRLLTLLMPDEQPTYMTLLTPTELPMIPEIKLYWNESKNYFVRCSKLEAIEVTMKDLDLIRRVTRRLMLSFFHSRMSDERFDYLWLLVPSDITGTPWNHSQLTEWIIKTKGSTPVVDLIRQGNDAISSWGLLSSARDQRKYFVRSTASSNSAFIDVAHVQAVQIPKRRDFLHPIPANNQRNEAYSAIEEFIASECSVGNLPAKNSLFALFVPSILYKHEIYMHAETLRTGLLAPMYFQRDDLALVSRAITASSTGETRNYQRLEFLGDCILKFIATVHLMADNPSWPESYLTGKKGKIVSNGFAARAALSAGLDKFILTKRFTGAKWSPRYAGDILDTESTEEHRKVSSKLLADVVESLIGAAFVVGGLPRATICIQTLLPLETWTNVSQANSMLFDAGANDAIHSLSVVESLIGYSFTKQMFLLEALTHGSYNGLLANCSYERMEFLGDAVLDYIVTTRLYAHKSELSHQKMHGIRTAMANGAFLSFRMFEMTVSEERVIPSTLSKGTKPWKTSQERCLWQYLRHSNLDLSAARDLAIKQHTAIRDKVFQSLQNDRRFPWQLFSLIDAPKFLSDIVESVIGAIYIDSKGDISSCEDFVRRLGILDCLERILHDEVDCLHPKERLGHLAVEKCVEYIKVTEKVSKTGSEADQMYKVQVSVGGKNVGGVVAGLKRLSAETMAAWEAIKILEGVDNEETNERLKDEEMIERVDDGEMTDVEEYFDANEGEVPIQ